MHDVMIDLETMSTQPDAAIVAIGAVFFDAASQQLGAEFYRVVSLDSAHRMGGHIEPGTVLWWMRQEEPARTAITGAVGTHINQALMDLSAWLSEHGGTPDKLHPWGNGAGFDLPILRTAYARASMPLPWMHWRERCYRTVKAQHPRVPLLREGTHHQALDDARDQARHMLAMHAAATTPEAAA